MMFRLSKTQVAELKTKIPSAQVSGVLYQVKDGKVRDFVLLVNGFSLWFSLANESERISEAALLANYPNAIAVTEIL